uniref:Uncharacterized protein n=1 Tax=Schistosoma japonicum TaxID=6182 RepID=C1LG02_SCHJA|nr:putative protein serine/threonine kinase [Schistosoma japonicum]
MSNEQISNVMDTNDTMNCINEVQLSNKDQIQQHEQQQQQQPSPSSSSLKDTIQLEEITVNHNELDENKANQNETVVVEKNDQCQIHIITSTELSKIVEDECEEEVKLKETSDKEDNLEKSTTSEIIDKSEEHSETTENSSGEKEKENKKKVNIVKWLKKNVHIHLPKRHSFKREKPVVEQKAEENSNEDSSSDKQVNSNPSNEIQIKEDTVNEQNGTHEETHKASELSQSISENTTGDISQTSSPTVPAQL